MGIINGDRVTLFLPNVPEFFFCYFGILKVGAVVNPLNVMLKQNEIDYIIGDCAPKAIVTTTALAAEPLKVFRKEGSNIEQMIVIGVDGENDTIHFEECVTQHPTRFDSIAVQRDDLAAILYTSGTTGQPKGVMLTHHNLWTNARHCADAVETTYRDIGVCALPLFHSYALTHVLAELWIEGGTVVWLNHFNAKGCLDAMAKCKATAFHGVATMYYAMLNEPTIDEYAKQISLRYCITGAAVTPEPILKAWNKKFTLMTEGYGITEGAPGV